MSILRPRKRRPYRQIERRYIVEYVANRYPRKIAAFYNVRLGPPPAAAKAMHPELPESWFKVWMPHCDAVVITDYTIDVIEAKIRYPRHGIGQLQDYARRVPYTPELRRFLPREIRMILVLPLRDPEIERTCQQFGIIVDYFTPSWVLDYMREVGILP